jgi:hypothetical protein
MAKSELCDLACLASRSTIRSGQRNLNPFLPFLPMGGATLIQYGDEDIQLDFDLFKNYGQIRFHWLSLKTRANDTNLLIELNRDERCRFGDHGSSDKLQVYHF